MKKYGIHIENVDKNTRSSEFPKSEKIVFKEYDNTFNVLVVKGKKKHVDVYLKMLHKLGYDANLIDLMTYKRIKRSYLTNKYAPVKVNVSYGKITPEALTRLQAEIFGNPKEVNDGEAIPNPCRVGEETRRPEENGVRVGEVGEAGSHAVEVPHADPGRSTGSEKGSRHSQMEVPVRPIDLTEAILRSPGFSCNTYADIFGVPRRTIYAWIKSGKLETFRNDDGVLLIKNQPPYPWKEMDETVWRWLSEDEYRAKKGL